MNGIARASLRRRKQIRSASLQAKRHRGAGAGRSGKAGRTRHLVVVLGDQLDDQSAAFDGFDQEQDAIAQMEVREEATYILQHRRRLAYFFASMRAFRDEQRASGRRVLYSELTDPANRGSLRGEVARRLEETGAEKAILIEPGDWRVRNELEALGPRVDIREDRHFLCSREAFDAFTKDRPSLRLETFYRFMRKRHDLLLDEKGGPLGGAWNFDAQNRASLGAARPPIPQPRRFSPPSAALEALALVAREFPQNPGRLDDFALPVTRSAALSALEDFVAHRLEAFGRYQDAMQSNEAILFHSRLSGPLNLHLLRPGEVVAAAIGNADAPLNSVEGFVRQVIGWREFIRGVYWRMMPSYADKNALGAELAVPRFYWTGETDMRCLAEAISHTIDHAYAHHIERLMVLGLFCQLLGVRPYEVHRWHMSMFWDAIDWASLPNTLGMSQYGDGGVVATKPYVASGNYINKMSDHCRHCRFDPNKATGDDACPFTTLYWDFLARHQQLFARNARMKFPYQNLARKSSADLREIRRQADRIKNCYS
jgi:deoxyribodipyrimidine photolyase-related protein